MEHEASKVKKLDWVLSYLNDNIPHGISQIIDNLNHNKSENDKWKLDELRIALKKLVKDGHIHASAGNDVFTISWEGSLFIELGGYLFKLLRDQNELELVRAEKALLLEDRKHNRLVADNMEANTGRLNTLTLWLAIGSGILALIELVRFLIFLFPDLKTFFQDFFHNFSN